MAKNTIKVKNYLNVMDEKVATAVAITPGFLLERTSGDLVQAHSTSDGTALPMFALEDELQGNGITDNYAVSVPVNIWIPTRGDNVYALLANGENIVIGDYLTSNGDGYLKKQDIVASAAEEAPQAVVGRALEAVDMSDSSSADPTGRIIIEVM